MGFWWCGRILPVTYKQEAVEIVGTKGETTGEVSKTKDAGRYRRDCQPDRRSSPPGTDPPLRLSRPWHNRPAQRSGFPCYQGRQVQPEKGRRRYLPAPAGHRTVSWSCRRDPAAGEDVPEFAVQCGLSRSPGRHGRIWKEKDARRIILKNGSDGQKVPLPSPSRKPRVYSMKISVSRRNRLPRRHSRLFLSQSRSRILTPTTSTPSFRPLKETEFPFPRTCGARSPSRRMPRIPGTRVSNFP